jgi:hypothetical protein
MKLVRYQCTHCGRKFEAEEKEILECPGCFWSTSVKKEEDVRSAAIGSNEAVVSKASRKPLNLKPLLKTLGILMALGVFVFAAIFLAPRAAGLFKKQTKPHPSATTPQKNTPQTKVPASSPQTVPGTTSPGTLTPEEKNILDRRIQVSADRVPDEEEQKILSSRASFQTGIVEKLPSQPWNLDGYKKMIREQEKIYQIPLPGSYKSKLEKLFTAKYVAASESFKNGDLLAARNQWVESLAFPIYADNVQKHRGVVLTMLRPFINDTLSKIGAINSSLVEKTLREKEKAISENYGMLLNQIQQKSWQEASQTLATLNQNLTAFSNPTQLAGQPATYPDAIRQVDDGVRATLFDLLQVPPPTVADLEPMRRDLFAKRNVVDSFLPDRLEAAQSQYQEAMDLIAQRQWREAEQKLKQITSPLALAKDAQQKIEILKKLQGPNANQNTVGQIPVQGQAKSPQNQ